MKKLLCMLSVLLLFLSVPVKAYSAEEQLSLASDGGTQYVIIVSKDAPPAEINAADILSDYLYRITGAVFEVSRDSSPEQAKELIVGQTNRNETDRNEKLDDDGVRIYTSGEKIVFNGGSPRGTVYSVYTFLEDWLGCRWFTHDLTVIPEKNVLTVPEINYRYEPCFKLRQTYWLFSTVYDDFCAAHKLQGVMAYMPEDLGSGRYELAVSSVHTAQLFVPRTMFASHPEYFGCDGNGVRTPDRQPCFSSEGVFDLALEYAKNYFSQYNAVLSVSQNDNMDFCKCPECSAFNASHGNVDSASLIDFINRLAREVKKDYPAAKIETLAYQNSQDPPTGLNVEDNVVIRLCAVSTCTLHGLDDPSCPKNADFSRNLEGWSKLTNHIYIWDYSTNFQYYYALYPNITALQGRYRFFRDRGVMAVFDNGCGDIIVPGEFHELRTYVILKLMWDPDTDIDRHIREFCECYYGEASDDVIDFINYYEKNARGWNIKSARICHNSCHDGGVGLLNNSSLTSVNVRRLDDIMEKARSKDLTDEQAYRLKGLELSWRFHKNACFVGEFNWYSGFTDPEAATTQLIDDMRDYGITALNENGFLRILDEPANAKMMPTFWYTDEDSLASDVKADLKIRVFVHRILYVLCAPLRVIMDLFAGLSD